MCHYKDRGALLTGYSAKQAHDRKPALRIQAGSRLIGQDDGGFVGQRARYGNSLTLAAGKLVGTEVGTVGYLEQLFAASFGGIDRAEGQVELAVGFM